MGCNGERSLGGDGSLWGESTGRRWVVIGRDHGEKMGRNKERSLGEDGS